MLYTQKVTPTLKAENAKSDVAFSPNNLKSKSNHENHRRAQPS
jgi:hypothetical protein